LDRPPVARRVVDRELAAAEDEGARTKGSVGHLEGSFREELAQFREIRPVAGADDVEPGSRAQLGDLAGSLGDGDLFHAQLAGEILHLARDERAPSRVPARDDQAPKGLTQLDPRLLTSGAGELRDLPADGHLFEQGTIAQAVCGPRPTCKEDALRSAGRAADEV